MGSCRPVGMVSGPFYLVLPAGVTEGQAWSDVGQIGSVAFPVLRSDGAIGSLRWRDVTQHQPLLCGRGRHGHPAGKPRDILLPVFSDTYYTTTLNFRSQNLAEFSTANAVGNTRSLVLQPDGGALGYKVRLTWAWCIHPSGSPSSIFQDPSMLNRGKADGRSSVTGQSAGTWEQELTGGCHHTVWARVCRGST